MSWKNCCIAASPVCGICMGRTGGAEESYVGVGDAGGTYDDERGDVLSNIAMAAGDGDDGALSQFVGNA